MRAEQTEKRKTMTKRMKVANIAAPTKVYPKRRELQGAAGDFHVRFVRMCFPK